MQSPREIGEREVQIARVLRPLRPRSHETRAGRARGQLLGVHWTTVYRLRARFLADPRTSALVPDAGGRRGELWRLAPPVEAIVSSVVDQWVPRRRELAHPCWTPSTRFAGAARNMVLWRRHATRWRAGCVRTAARNSSIWPLPGAAIAPGSFGADWPLEIVQIDHTQADVLIVDRFTRKVIGRPWLSVAIDLATHGPGLLHRHGAARCWHRGAPGQSHRPAQGGLAGSPGAADRLADGRPAATAAPDNAAEFRSRALRPGCAQYGIELDHRPVGRPNYGGHIERMNRTLMQRLKGLPGATGNSPRGRKAQARTTPCLTLEEFERWLALEVGERYHHSEHRGLFRSTPSRHGSRWLNSVPSPTGAWAR